jgi:transcription elongation factor Elf1
METTHCPRCSSGVVSISLTMSGERVVLHSCNTCDFRFWNRDGQAVELASVLALAERRKARV